MPDEQLGKGISAVGLQLVLGQHGGVEGMCRKVSGERLIAGKVQVWAPLIDGMGLQPAPERITRSLQPKLH